MCKETKHFYEFGPFRVDVAERQLLRDGEVISLTPKAFDTLLLLVENSAHTLEKEVLLKNLWPDTFVDEGNLAQNISILRKALGDSTAESKYIETIPKRGYRFVAEVRRGEADQAPGIGRRAKAVAIVAAVLIAGAFFWSRRSTSSQEGAGVRSLAVLPLMPLEAGAEESLLGLGIADGIIGRLSRIETLRVRPTNTVRKYLGQDGDPIAVARELKVDAVLTGTTHRAGDRLRVSINLLRTIDAASLWAETFDVSSTNPLAIEDQVSGEVATRLRLSLTAAERSRLAKRDTSSAEAHEYYLRGSKAFDNRLKGSGTRPSLESSIALFQKAVEIDPAYARAHAQLAFAYVWMGLFVDMDNTVWLERAEDQLRRAQALDPMLAEVHLVRHTILSSGHGGFKVEDAVRELELARQLDPSVGRSHLGNLYAHIGLEEQAIRELQRSTEIDPVDPVRLFFATEGYYLLGRADEAIARYRRFWNRPGPAFALIAKGQLDDAEPQIKEGLAQNPDGPHEIGGQALILALRGKFAEAEAQMPAISRLRKNPSYHHAAHDFAVVYALQGKAPSALKWLRETVDTGMPSYLLLSRDAKFDRIRNDAGFIKFMAEMKTRWERYRLEFP